MSSVLEGLEGVICHMDDTLIHGHTQEVHNIRVRQALDQIHNAGLTLTAVLDDTRPPAKFVSEKVRFLERSLP